MTQNRNSSSTRMWLAALALTALAGCGGGGGGGGGGGSGASTSGAASGPTGAACAGASCVSLGSAANYAILAKTGVSTVPASVVTGHVGLSPAARTALTGWSLIADSADEYFTSSQVTGGGKLYAADNVGGTTSVDLTTAVGDMQTAYTDAAGKPAGVGPNLNLGAGTVAGQTLAPGTYTWGSNVNITTNLTLNGSATDIWIFQIAGTLDMATATSVIMAGGALAKNVFWQVSGAVTVGANTHFEGIILGQTGITFGNLSSINGRLLAQSAVVLDATTVTVPQ
jgi:Ice-binding-like